jgi:serine phosphatase RsbU (regulator of sigma subunit)/Tfp pilus assembly protein PilF
MTKNRIITACCSKKFLLLYFWLAYGCTCSVAQTRRIDSLIRLLKISKEDTSKANVLNELARAHLFELNDISKMYIYGVQGLRLSRQLNYKKGIAYGLMHTGIFKRSHGDHKEAIMYAEKSLALMKEIGYKKGEGSCYINLGVAYLDIGNYPKSIEFTLKGMILKEQIGDKKGAAVAANNLSEIFTDQGNYKEALKYLNKCLKFGEETGDKISIAMAYENIGLISYTQGRLDEALEYFKKTAKISEELDDKMGMASSYSNLGNTYFKKNKIDDAFTYQLKALKIAKGYKDKDAIVIAYNSLGAIYIKKGNYHLAIDYFNKAINISKEIDSKGGLLTAYEHLIVVYKQLKNSEEALHYLDAYHDLNDSILNKDNFRQLAELSTKYETEKKEKEILLLTKDKELNGKIIRQQQLVRWGLIGGLGLLFISIFSIYRRYRFKQKANRILEKQKEVILQKNNLITDSINYAKTIQEAVLPTAKHVETLFPESFVFYKPKAIVSGDFYWINQTGDRLICAVADCTGHGVPGAFMSLLGFNILENITKQIKDIKPVTILESLNGEVITRLSSGDEKEVAKHGMDISLISIDRTSNMLEYAGAHNPVYIVRDKELIELKADKMGIGTPHTGTFINKTIELKKGDMIYLFTDGFPDQIGGPKRKKFYYQPFKELLIANSGNDMKTQREQLDTAHMQWRDEKYDQTDDILVMGIRYGQLAL